jgi:inhibitor of KinA
MITVGDSIDEATHRHVRAIDATLEKARISGATDRVSAFASVAVHYDPMRVPGDPATLPYDRIVEALQQALAHIAETPIAAPRTVELPVCYGGELGPDLEEVARLHDLTQDQVIEIHAAGDYLVYMIGFMPGFAYLGGLDPQLATPRRGSPRMAVPAGTVGIGGDQTGVYPLVSPGGWNLIGRTPLKLFDIGRDEPTLLAAGERVRFRPISLNEFRAWPA